MKYGQYWRLCRQTIGMPLTTTDWLCYYHDIIKIKNVNSLILLILFPITILWALKQLASEISCCQNIHNEKLNISMVMYQRMWKADDILSRRKTVFWKPLLPLSYFVSVITSQKTLCSFVCLIITYITNH